MLTVICNKIILCWNCFFIYYWSFLSNCTKKAQLKYESRAQICCVYYIVAKRGRVHKNKLIVRKCLANFVVEGDRVHKKNNYHNNSCAMEQFDLKIFEFHVSLISCKTKKKRLEKYLAFMYFWNQKNNSCYKGQTGEILPSSANF
jgi:hypothetical protein